MQLMTCSRTRRITGGPRGLDPPINPRDPLEASQGVSSFKKNLSIIVTNGVCVCVCYYVDRHGLHPSNIVRLLEASCVLRKLKMALSNNQEDDYTFIYVHCMYISGFSWLQIGQHQEGVTHEGTM